ncbi:MAG: hypothetical protein QM808_08365 [Steroidobacteraceae bacterium]
MNARVLFILLVIGLLLAVTRRYRKLGIGLSSAMALLLLWLNIHVAPSATTSIHSTSSSSNTSVKELPTAQLQDVQLTGNGAPWRLTGSVQNTSNFALRALTLNIERLDCPAADAKSTDCTLLWRGSRVTRVEVAPMGNGKIDESFYSHDAVPRLSGVARDGITLTAVE